MPAAAQPVLPDGPGKAAVENSCQACHALTNITNAGHTPKDWDTVVHMMINAGAKLPPDQVPVVVNYLAAHFPARALPAPRFLPAMSDVTIKEWDVPTHGSRPHDPMFAPDGSAWYTGQMANVLGRFDPKTQTFREFHLPDGSGPHGLIADHDGNVWYTANFKAYIGKLDPKTGKVTQYPMPDPRARDPHTLLLAPNGHIYFTAQNANMAGRLNPKTGEIKLVNSPTPRSNPYGMVIDSHGVPYYVEFGSNKVARMDPDTLAIREFSCPIRMPARAASPSPPTISSGIPTMPAGSWAGSIPKPAPSRNGRRRAVHVRSLMASPQSAMRSGTANPIPAPIPWYASTPGPAGFRLGPFRRGEGWCATWSPRRTAISGWPAAGSTRSRSWRSARPRRFGRSQARRRERLCFLLPCPSPISLARAERLAA